MLWPEQTSHASSSRRFPWRFAHHRSAGALFHPSIAGGLLGGSPQAGQAHADRSRYPHGRVEPHVFGPANVQYTDWKGTVALDEPDYPERLYKLAGLDPEDWSILGLNIWGGRVDDGELKSGVHVYAARAAHRTGLDELTKDGRISVVEVEVEHEGAALHLFEDVFKQWSVHAKLAALEQREIQLEITEHG
jgi:hypothetical protein